MFYWLSLVKSIWNKISPKKSKKTVLDEVKLEKLDQTTNSYNRKPNELDTLENRSLTAEEAGTNLEDSEIKNITLQLRIYKHQLRIYTFLHNKFDKEDT